MKAAPQYQEFRADIQGLRALAILLVVACHASLPGFSGGFVGVDIFFVISGYLITSLLQRELLSEKKINLADFYARRAKRLLPALLFVFIATLFFARMFLSPFEQVEQMAAAYFVPLWLSNFYFSFADLGYFAAESSTNLFLHTWSLGVEEQFYLLWPFLLTALVAKQISAGADNQSIRVHLRSGLVVIAVGGFVLGLVVYYMAPLHAFYMMPARAWQFATGGLVFLLVENPLGRNGSGGRLTASSTLVSYFGFAGLLMIGWSLVVVDENTGYPGFPALLPTIGTALLLWSGAVRQTQVSRLLGTGCMRWIGNISYSWYLWHWPVLLLGAVVLGPVEESFRTMLFLVLLSLAMAWFSFLVIESPVRNAQVLTRKPVLALVSSLALMFSTPLLLQSVESQARMDTNNEALQPYLQARNDRPAIYQLGCDDWYTSPRVLACAFGSENAEKKAVLIADSIGAQWFNVLVPNFVQAGWQFIVYTKSACPIVDQPYFYPLLGMEYENCAKWRGDLLVSLEELAPDVVFIGSSTGYDFSTEQWMTGTARVLESLVPWSPDVILIVGTMGLPFNGPACLERKAWQPHSIRELNPCTAYAETALHRDALAGLQAAVTSYPNTRLLDPNPLVCPDGICAAERGGQVVYRDNAHLANGYVTSLTLPFIALLKAELEQTDSPLKFLWTSEASEATP